jgi:hypothetical protein
VKLTQIPHTHIDAAWAEGAYLLDVACDRTDEVTGGQLKMMLSRNELQLLKCENGWAAVRVDQLPNYRALHVYAIHAPGVRAFDQLKDYARFFGCSAIRGACDDAVARLWTRLGARKKYQIMEWDI